VVSFFPGKVYYFSFSEAKAILCFAPQLKMLFVSLVNNLTFLSNNFKA
jgi:hypothetical protein